MKATVPLKFTHDECETIRHAIRELAKGQDLTTRLTLIACCEYSDEVLGEAFQMAMLDADEDVITKILRDCVIELERRKKEGAGHA
jgi:hypothetical protein